MFSFKKVCVLSMLLTGTMFPTAPAGYVEQKLTLNDMTGDEASFGASVAAAKDGKTIVVGAPGDNENTGSVIVYKLQSDGFHQDGPKLVAENTIGSEPCFGHSVAISANGTRIAAAAPEDNNNMGAVFVFDYDAQKAVWEQTAKIVSTDVIGTNVKQGARVAFSSDGSTLTFSAVSDNNGVGAVWVYIYNGTTWIEQAKLVGSNPIGQTRQGSGLAISADGNTIAFGASNDNQGQGCAYVFGRNNSTWTQIGSKHQCSDITDAANLGTSVTLSSDGTSLLVGAPGNNNSYGAVCRFMKSGSQYIQQGNSFKGTDSSTGANQGASVALSGNKQTLVVGAYYDFNGVGSFYLFDQVDGSGFKQQGNKITVSNPLGDSEVGYSTAISENAETFVIGAPYDDQYKGGVWAFYKPEETSPSTSFFDTTAGQIVAFTGGAVAATIIGFLVEKYILEKICHLKCPSCCCKKSNPMGELLLEAPSFSMSTDAIA